MPYSQYLATRILNWHRGVANGVAGSNPGMPAAPSTIYISVHSADPGPLGTANDVTNIVATARGSIPAANWSVPTEAPPPATGFQMSNTAAVTISGSAPGTATVSYFGCWDAAVGGNFLEYGPLANPLTIAVGDIVRFSTGQLVLRKV